MRPDQTIFVENSTLPVRTADTVKAILSAAQREVAGAGSSKTFSVLSNPEFLAECTAIPDLESPDRVLIGGEDPAAIEILATVHRNWVPQERTLRTNLWSSELSKLTANSFLAQRISSINSIAALCEATGADVTQVAHFIGTDSRFGPKFLKAGPGFGGSCFQKDILNLVYLCSYSGLNAEAACCKASSIQHLAAGSDCQRVVQWLFGTLTGKRIAVLPAFKADTNDTRNIPPSASARTFWRSGSLAIYDPKVPAHQMGGDLGTEPQDAPTGGVLSGEGVWQRVATPAQAVAQSDAVSILTEWTSFAQLDWADLAPCMRKPA